MALEAIYNYKMPAGQELSAVSLSWGLDEAQTDPREMDAADKWMGALLEKVRSLPARSWRRSLMAALDVICTCSFCAPCKLQQHLLSCKSTCNKIS